MEDSLRPRLDWGTEAQRFAAETGRQATLCVICVKAGSFDPPSQIVILDGRSLCLPHSDLVAVNYGPH